MYFTRRKCSVANRKHEPCKHPGITKVDQRNEKVTCIVKEKVCVLRHYKIDKDMTKEKEGSVSDGNYNTRTSDLVRASTR
jgi:hypothetical protein